MRCTMKILNTAFFLITTSFSCSMNYLPHDTPLTPHKTVQEFAHPKEYILSENQINQFFLPENVRPYGRGAQINVDINDAHFQIIITQSVKDALESGDAIIKQDLIDDIKRFSKVELSKQYNDFSEGNGDRKISGIWFNLDKGSIYSNFEYHLPTKRWEYYAKDGGLVTLQSN